MNEAKLLQEMLEDLEAEGGEETADLIPGGQRLGEMFAQVLKDKKVNLLDAPAVFAAAASKEVREMAQGIGKVAGEFSDREAAGWFAIKAIRAGLTAALVEREKHLASQ